MPIKLLAIQRYLSCPVEAAYGIDHHFRSILKRRRVSTSYIFVFTALTSVSDNSRQEWLTTHIIVREMLRQLRALLC